METRLKANYYHHNDQFRVKTKRLALRMTAQPYNRFVFVLYTTNATTTTQKQSDYKVVNIKAYLYNFFDICKEFKYYLYKNKR